MDETLLKQAGAGNRRAAAQLIRRHGARIQGLSMRMLNDATEAEDIVQETFIRVWKAAPRWKPGQAKVSTWMCRIAVNLCLDRLRKPKMRTMEAAPEMRDESATPSEELDAQERAQVVRAAMSGLPERQRAAIAMCYFQDLSNIEAAEALDVSVDALESLLARGRRALKSLLAESRDDLLETTPQGKAAGFGGIGSVS